MLMSDALTMHSLLFFSFSCSYSLLKFCLSFVVVVVFALTKNSYDNFYCIIIIIVHASLPNFTRIN
ncbi:hypothetical protein, unlikely [Trypanosoma brucei gambiense DAL972]|uniref:Uncharacterized protein n=1 Tax=Trypanosoma brucei gambiense (strain MHOM/CI/86/DAL972) TaxID=679716 RepID=C9ZSD7_TRYB9|nr:hypothetical protein, unlikely [Trypanosoma brucei gambiense DAL972]CBH12275.1 hypothetical protein, unlikely [Trypanosoma brucei gambiense DAL972]|eukprot:XP_011774556.1 hypothetical protein, unlikely [Trypanosoma brucei gambiense DAL972]